MRPGATRLCDVQPCGFRPFHALPKPPPSISKLITPVFALGKQSPLRIESRSSAVPQGSSDWEETRPIDVDDNLEEVSMSSRCGESHGLWSEQEEGLGYAALPLAAMSMTDIGKNMKDLYDKVYFGSGEFLPIVGTVRMSYARLLQLLDEKKIKRIFLMADGQVAIVEAPFETHASDYKQEVRYDKNDPSAVYIDQKPEWQMEKMRYYCELPGDIWEDGTFMKLIKRNQYHHTAKGRVKYEWLLREHQVTTELVVLDPNDSLLFLNDQMSQIVPILGTHNIHIVTLSGCVGLFVLRGFVGVSDWLLAKFFAKKKDEMSELAEQYARPRAVEFNIGEGASRNDTGVRFEDVAGIDKVKEDIIEVIRMMRGDDRFIRMGGKAPRGILLEGPPGTGKTYLARAMAGEGAMPFYSCNGAEFVEMFSGVAAARIRNVFKSARAKAPSILFIDEIDAIAKKRGIAGDAGASEREAGLMQLLVEMDGIIDNDQVLIIGATNRIGLLDPALLRPGRFDRIIYMGRPSESNRLKILQVHSRDKVIPREISNEKYEDDAILRETARLTMGYSGADLANILNESAILSVREANVQEGDDVPVISMDNIRDAMEKARVGLPQEKLPPSKAKRFLATIQAGRNNATTNGKAVALALTPGMPEIEAVNIRPQGNLLGRILFEPAEYGREGDMWHNFSIPGGEANNVKLDHRLGAFEVCCGLLVPLYAGRVTEELLYGPDSVTLSTSKEVSKAGELAYYLVAKSNLHPAFRQIPVRMRMRLGGEPDPTVGSTAEWFDRHVTHLQEVSYRRAVRLIEERRPVIEKVSDLLCSRQSESVSGSELLELLRDTPLGPSSSTSGTFDFEKAWLQDAHFISSTENGNGNGKGPRVEMHVPNQRSGSTSLVKYNERQGKAGRFWMERNGTSPTDLENFEISIRDARTAMEVVLGNVNLLELLAEDVAATQINQMRNATKNSAVLSRLKSVKKYSTEKDAPFPIAPDIFDEDGKPIFKDYMRSRDIDTVDFVEDVEFWTKQ